uniref:Gx transporter family protein n=1 Tax=Caldisericum exile TaxID=693075 RepID=A0A7C4Y3P4_9BACT
MSTPYPTNMQIKKIVYLAVLVSVGVVLNLLEPVQLFPLLPGAKLGLANLSTLLTIIMFPNFEGILVAILRTIVSTIFRGTLNWISFGTSFFGGVGAAIVMTLLYKSFKKNISIVGISAVGGIVNNVIQAIFVYLVTNNVTFLYYILFLIPIGGVAGSLIGILTNVVYNRMAKL